MRFNPALYYYFGYLASLIILCMIGFYMFLDYFIQVVSTFYLTLNTISLAIFMYTCFSVFFFYKFSARRNPEVLELVVKKAGEKANSWLGGVIVLFLVFDWRPGYFIPVVLFISVCYPLYALLHAGWTFIKNRKKSDRADHTEK